MNATLSNFGMRFGQNFGKSRHARILYHGYWKSRRIDNSESEQELSNFESTLYAVYNTVDMHSPIFFRTTERFYHDNSWKVKFGPQRPPRFQPSN